MESKIHKVETVEVISLFVRTRFQECKVEVGGRPLLEEAIKKA